MTRRIKTNLKIATATATCIFSLASAFTVTLAWFSSNQVVSTNGMTFKVKSLNSLISKVTIHNCYLDETTSTVIRFNSTPAATINVSGAGQNVMTSDAVDIDDYSDLYPSKPVLFLFTLVSGVKDEQISLSATTTESIVGVVNEADVYKTPLSSAVWFKSASYSVDPFPYDNVVVSNLTSTAQFADYSLQTPSFNQTINLYTGSTSTVVKYIAVVMEYEITAIETIRINNTELALEYDRIGFYCDWIMEM